MTSQPGADDGSDMAAAAGPWTSPMSAWWMVVVLALGLTLALMDRLIIALMIKPIKHDLSLSDTQVSLLQGLAFTITYVVAGLPLGRAADRGSRRLLAGGSIVFWSVMTAVCGLAHSFSALFAARLGVGVGEAGLSPAALSLISDAFPPHRRTKPLAVMTVGTTAGAGLALMLGGLVVQSIGDAGGLDLPGLGHLRSWQAVFVLLGIGGLLFSALFTTVVEPRRREIGALTRPGIVEVARFVLARRRFFIAQLVGPGLAVLTLVAFHSWMPTLLERRFNWSVAEAGLGYGAVMIVAGCLGVVGAGVVADRLAARGARTAAPTLAAASAGLAFPFLVVGPLMPDAHLILAVLFPGLALVAVPSTLAPAALQSVVPNAMRGQVFSIYLLVISILGYAMGPLLVALVTDRLIGDERSLHISLSLVALVALPLATLFLWAARRAMPLPATAKG